MQSGRGSAAEAAAVGRVREGTSRSRSLVLLDVLHAQLHAGMGRRIYCACGDNRPRGLTA